MHRAQSRGEEIANSVSHGVGFVAAVAVLPVLAVNALQHGAASVVGALVFGVSAALLYLTSTLYHALTPVRAKQVFRVLDHGAIYVLIAGTYTPFMLGVLRGPWGWTLLGAIWVLAIFGIVLKARVGVRHPRFSTALYLGMGWLVVVAAKPFLDAVPVSGLALARRRRPRVHRRGRLLRGQPPPLPALRLAPLRAGGHGVPCGGGAGIRRMTLPASRVSCALWLIGLLAMGPGGSDLAAQTQPLPSQLPLAQPAPDSFLVVFDTTKGTRRR